jgi:hypothetical protein
MAAGAGKMLANSSLGSFEQAVGYQLTQLWDEQQYADSGIHSQGEVFSPNLSELDGGSVVPGPDGDLFNNNLEGLDDPLLLHKFLQQLHMVGGLNLGNPPSNPNPNPAAKPSPDLQAYSIMGSGDPSHPLNPSSYNGQPPQQQQGNPQYHSNVNNNNSILTSNANGNANNNNNVDFNSAGNLGQFGTADLLSVLTSTGRASGKPLNRGMQQQQTTAFGTPMSSAKQRESQQQYLMSTPHSQSSALPLSATDMLQHVSPIPGSAAATTSNLHATPTTSSTSSSSSSHFQTIDSLLKQEKASLHFQVSALSLALFVCFVCWRENACFCCVCFKMCAKQPFFFLFKLFYF